MTETLSDLKAQRASTKGCITRIKNIVDTKGETLTEAELECRLGIVESYFKQAISYQLAIEKLMPEDENEQKVRSDLEDLFCATKAKLLTLLNGQRKSTTFQDSVISFASGSVNHLPKLKLPQFGGKYSEFPNFMGTFSVLVDKNETLSKIEKFNHLLSCLTGPALRTIKVFEVTENNYKKALDTLKNRYDNKYIIFQEHIVDLFNLPKVSRNSASQLRLLVDSTNAHLHALQSLGSSYEILNSIIIHLVNSKLDVDSQCKWEDKVDASKLPSWENCADILNRRCQYLEARDAKSLCELPSTSFGTSRPSAKTKGRKASHKATAFTVTHGTICTFCNQTGHVINQCPMFLELSVLSRFEEVKKRALCINCLSKGHSVRKCSARKCRVCEMPHHTLLHRYTSGSTSSSPPVPTKALTQNFNAEQTQIEKARHNDSSSPLVLISSKESQDHVFLASAVVKVRDRSGQYQPARALLDSASQVNFISESLAQSLKLRREKVDMSINGIGSLPTKVRWCTRTMVKSSVSDFETGLSMYIIPHLTGLQPDKKVSIDSWEIPQNIQLADPLFFQPQRVDLLIGADTFFNLICVGQIKLKDNIPLLQKTLLGWIVSGRYCQGSSSGTSRCNVAHISANSNVLDETYKLDEIVEKFWQEEHISSSPPKLSKEHELCEVHFKNNVCRLATGKFMVRLPFKESPDSHLGKSFERAHRRFLSLERRLSKNLTLKSKYTEFLSEYLVEDHMELISMAQVPRVHYFMPHQCVLRPLSSTTKLRVVFDASCCTDSNKSLNDLLMIGPTIQDDLFSILNRFRCYKFALTADIAAMYRQIWMHPEDRNFQLILWRENCNEELKVFRLKTVTYGTASAPFLATRCLLQLAEDNSLKYPIASKVISKDFYMDDLLTGADSCEELYVIRTEVDIVLRSSQFILRKWYSNHQQFLAQIPESERQKTLKLGESDVVKTLGLIWEPAVDNFRFHYHGSEHTMQRITKRHILSDTARLFDPLGLINPITVRAKMFIQELWLMKLDWDESLPQVLEYRWREFLAELNCVHNIHIPRKVLVQGQVSNIQFHGFADASTKAYGCCVYVVSTNSEAGVEIQLLAAKSRVAPIRTARSLPCLELCAALLLARLLKKLLANFPKPVSATYLWTDSEIVLDWLCSHPSSWKTFVANRVAEVQNLTNDATWRHVPTKLNPADIISRGIRASEISKSIWFSGPHFLRQSQDNWPPLKERHVNTENLPERRKTVPVLLCTSTESFLAQVYEISSFSKNLRRFAFAVRFMKNLLAKRNGQPIVTGELVASEVDDTFMRLVWAVQQEAFAPEIKVLKTGDKVAKSSKISKLSPFLDESLGFQLLRVGGRLKQANLPYDSKCPILLPGRNALVTSYVNHLHLKNFHAGPQALTSLIQQRFWIVNARDYARRTVRNCIHCFRYRPRLGQQLMADLPKGRVNISLPFTHCGVDFCGPITTTHKLRGKALFKSYIAIFICFVTRAVHIEVVSDLTSNAFIAALKRFIGRRNLCRHLYCDNATNFVGAKRQLQEFRDAFLKEETQKDIVRWCTDNSIEFHFIPPRSPHFGGMWEAAVKSAKTHLYKTMRDALLTFEELTTVMVQIEAALNSRPITPLSTDPNDEQALTPFHFLNQVPVHGVVEPNIPITNFKYIHRWQRITALQQHFWQRWSREYLVQLQERGKWRAQYPNIVEGTLVLIQQDDAPPYKWKLGRVVETFKGPDGKVRVVNLKTSTGISQRAIHKVAPIPLQED